MPPDLLDRARKSNYKNMQISFTSNSDPQLDAIKLPPHSVEAEQSVLGGILLDTTALDKISDLISEQDFYRFEHRLIFRHIARLSDHAKAVDVITVAESLESNAELDKAGDWPIWDRLRKMFPLPLIFADMQKLCVSAVSCADW